MQQADSGFVRITHRRCEDCDIRGDLHASGSPLPKRYHTISKCATCGGKGEIRVAHSEGLDPYRSKDLPRMIRFLERRLERAHSERHRFRARTRLEDICRLLMEIPPGGFNHGRAKAEDGSWQPLESEGRDGDVFHSPSWKRPLEPLKHGTRYAYEKAGCRCFTCRRWNATRVQAQRDVLTPITEGKVRDAA